MLIKSLKWLVNKDFRDGISDVIVKDKAEFERYFANKGSDLAANVDLITILVRYVRKTIKDLLDNWGSSKDYSNINFDKSMLDNATELGIRAFFEEPINKENKQIENATPIGQEPAKKIGTEGNIVEPTRIEGLKEQEAPQANVGDSNLGGKAKPKVEGPKLEVDAKPSSSETKTEQPKEQSLEDLKNFNAYRTQSIHRRYIWWGIYSSVAF